MSSCMADGPTAAEALRNVERIAQEWGGTGAGASGARAEGALKYA